MLPSVDQILHACANHDVEAISTVRDVELAEEFKISAAILMTQGMSHIEAL